MAIALADIDCVQRQRNGFGRRRVDLRGRPSAFRLATQVKKKADEVFYVFGPNVEIDWTLLTALDLQPNYFAARRNVACNLNHKRQTPSGRLLMGAQSDLLEPPCPPRPTRQS